MGILTNALSQLTGQAFKFGFDQLDNFVTRKIQEGQHEEAFQALDQWENQMGQQLAGGGGILPTGQPGGQIPSQPATQPLDLISNPQAMAQIQKSPLASEMTRARGQQLLQNDPFFIQQEAQRKQQEELMGLNKQLGFETFKQNQAGTAGARDIFGGGDIGQDVRNQASAARTGILEEAKEPARQRAFQRQVQLKQTPGARAMGSGEGGPAKPRDVSTALLNNWQKQLADDKSGVYATTAQGTQFTAEQIAANPNLAIAATLMGGQEKANLTDRGQRVMDIAEQLAAGSKTRSPRSILNQAKVLEKKEFTQQRQQDPNAFQGFAGEKAPAQQAQPTEPTAQQKATQMTDEQKIQILRQRGVPEEEIQKALGNPTR